MPAARSTRHAAASVGTDLASIVVAVLGYAVLRGSPHDRVLILGLGLLALTAGCLALERAWDPAVVGGARTGEFARLLRGFVDAGAATALVVLAAGIDDGRAWVFGVLPAAAALAVLGRLALRHDLHRRRRHGEAMAMVLAVGSAEAVAELIQRTRATPRLGWRVAAVCTPTGAGPNGGAYVEQVPVVGDLDSVPVLSRDGRFDLVSVSPAPGWTPWRLRQLAGELDGTATELASPTELAKRRRSATGERFARLVDVLMKRLAALIVLTYLTARRLRPTRRAPVTHPHTGRPA